MHHNWPFIVLSRSVPKIDRPRFRLLSAPPVKTNKTNRNGSIRFSLLKGWRKARIQALHYKSLTTRFNFRTLRGLSSKIGISTPLFSDLVGPERTCISNIKPAICNDRIGPSFCPTAVWLLWQGKTSLLPISFRGCFHQSHVIRIAVDI